MLQSIGSFAQAFAQQTAPHAAAAETASATPQPPAEVLFHILGIPVTNSLLTAWIVIAILVLFAYFSTRNMRLMPTGLQNFWELIIELWMGIAVNTMGERRARRFMPLVATAF